MDVEVAVNLRNRCGEGPLWDFHDESLVWTDIESRILWRFEPTTRELAILSRERSVSGLALGARGGLVLGGADGLAVLEADGALRSVLTERDGQALSFNDILAAPGGRLYAGSIHWGADGMLRPGELFLIHPDGRSEVVDEGIELANGIALSGDDRTLYFADTAARRIFAHDVDSASGRLSRKRVFASIPAKDGIPDGITVDSEGFLWCALWYGAQVVRYDPDGKLERRLRVPALQVSSVAFGGVDLGDLYITSALDPWASPLEPPGYNAKAAETGGPVFRARPGVQGRREHVARL